MKGILAEAASFFNSFAFAGAAAPANEIEQPAIIRHRLYRQARVVTTTRVVGTGTKRFRETLRVTYLPDGRKITRVVGREPFTGIVRISRRGERV